MRERGRGGGGTMTRFLGCNLQNARFEDTNCQGAAFIKCNLRGTKFNGAITTDADFTGSLRNNDDDPIPGWVVIDGVLTRAK